MSMMTQKKKWRQILQLKDTPVTNMLFLVFAGVSMLMNKVPPPVCVCLTGVLVSQRVCVCVCVCVCADVVFLFCFSLRGVKAATLPGGSLKRSTPSAPRLSIKPSSLIHRLIWVGLDSLITHSEIEGCNINSSQNS